MTTRQWKRRTVPDWAAVLRLKEGDPTVLCYDGTGYNVDLVTAITDLADAGLSDPQIADRLPVLTGAAVRVFRKRHGITSRYEPHEDCPCRGTQLRRSHH